MTVAKEQYHSSGRPIAPKHPSFRAPRSSLANGRPVAEYRVRARHTAKQAQGNFKFGALMVSRCHIEGLVGVLRSVPAAVPQHGSDGTDQPP